MGRTKTNIPLNVFQDGILVGILSKSSNGAIDFCYSEKWLSNPHSIPISLSLPLREDSYKGAPVTAFFDNLLPDSDILRMRIAEKFGANGTDPFSLLTHIGRDCVGALQFLPETWGTNLPSPNSLQADPIEDVEIESILKNLASAPLGLNPDNHFRISIAGAQEKTALLFFNKRWHRPIGSTPTTHILKTQLGTLPNGIDLSDSVENEFYGLKIMEAFSLPANKAEIKIFGKTKALVIERFDRKWTEDGNLQRLPQEDICQALSIPSSRKYQNDYRPKEEKQPSIVEILNLLKFSDDPVRDQKLFLKAQIVFWLIGAIDGHAKNFSIFLGAQGRFHLTPFYDVLTAQPFFDRHQLEQKSLRMAMSVGQNNHYKIDEICGRHFKQTAQQAGLPNHIITEAIEEIASRADQVCLDIEKTLPSDFPEDIHLSVQKALKIRLQRLI
jgi:serine/threonine-protein kinase HipA